MKKSAFTDNPANARVDAFPGAAPGETQKRLPPPAASVR